MADHSVVFKDLASAKEVLQGFTGQNSEDWVVFGYPKGNDGHVSALGHGQGGLDAAQKAHFHEDNIAYLLLAFGSRGEGDYVTLKHILVTWIGPKCTPRLRAKSSQHRVMLYNAIRAIIQKMDGEMQMLSREEVSIENIHEKVLGTRYVSDESGTESSAAAKGKSRTGEMEEFSVRDQESLFVLLDQCRSDELNWIQFGYEKGQGQGEVQVVGSGSGGFAEVNDSVEDDQVQYILLGLHYEDEGDYTQVKWCLLTWVGKDVPPYHKARSSQHRVLLYNLINSRLQLAGEYQALSRADFTQRQVVDKLTSSKVGSKSEKELREAAALDAEKKAKREGSGMGSGSSAAKVEGENPCVNAEVEMRL